ncbi:MAG: oligosaccharide flippase family protein [Bacteroidales bacterium]|nr:oligosaccharide flippase family protein [Bacteroidales bacterium]
MLKKIIHTTGAKTIESALNFIIVWVSSYYLGSEIYGKIALLTLIVFFVSQLNGLVTGNSLLYYASRARKRNLFTIAFVWIIAVASITFLVIYFGLSPIILKIKSFTIHELLSIPILIILTSSVSVFQNYLLGRELILKANYFSLSLVISRLIIISTIVIGFQFISFWAFVITFICSYSIVFIVQTIIVSKIKESDNIEFRSSRALFKPLILYGSVMQGSSVLQILNQRISYFFISSFLSVSSLGVFGLAMQISESIKLVGMSISDVLLTKFSNTNDKDKNVHLTINSFRFTLYITLLSVLFVAFIPSEIFTKIFGNDYVNIKPIILTLLPGVLAYSVLLVIIQYFNGSGRPKVVFLLSLSGIIIISAIQIPLMKQFGLLGAGIANSCVFIVSLIIGLILFTNDSKQKLKVFLPQKNDWVVCCSIVKSIKHKTNRN